MAQVVVLLLIAMLVLWRSTSRIERNALVKMELLHVLVNRRLNTSCQHVFTSHTQRLDDGKAHLGFTSMRYTPSIHRRPVTRTLLSWPLQRHISGTRNRLPQIIKAVLYVLRRCPARKSSRKRRFACYDPVFEDPVQFPQACETVQLVEH